MPDFEAGSLVITGEEAHHAARVKRLEIGDQIDLLNGRGAIARAAVKGLRKERREWAIELEVGELCRIEPVRPRVEVWSPAPKGARLEEMIEGISEVGAASWQPLHAERAVAEPRQTRLDRLARTCIEAAKQCGRAWLLELGAGGDVPRALAGAPVVVADAAGEPLERSAEPLLRLLVGPEGGWSEREIAAFRKAGARICRFGPHTMRIETAAVVAAGVILAREMEHPRAAPANPAP